MDGIVPPPEPKDNRELRISERLVAAIKNFEGYSEIAYRDPVGIWTIGYGRTEGVKADMITTEEHAEAALRQRLERDAKNVRALVDVPMTQGMFEALVDFVYNLGIGRFTTSTLRKKLNEGDLEGAANEFGKWVFAGSQILPGLVRRRAQEREWFLGTNNKEENVRA